LKPEEWKSPLIQEKTHMREKTCNKRQHIDDKEDEDDDDDDDDDRVTFSENR
jgi:hypothetical protein